MVGIKQKPWEEKWELVKDLSGGGQGETQHVRSRENPSQHGVLKKLVSNRANDPTSRQRMHQEVSNLEILGAAGAKVPKIYDSNTVHFAGTDELYFVMELIEGDSLTKLMEKKKKLFVDEAFDLALDLSKTLMDCHHKSIMHRDLKPDNIIIRRPIPIEAVIVDYGLSFNEKAPLDLSRGDRIGNGFTDLPERETPEAQRYYQSDITAVCGIFYYCVTGHRPTPFRDATNGLAPHRRKQPGLSLREAMKDHPAITRLETLFDQAFEERIADRIGSAKDFIERLLHARAAKGGERKSLNEILKDRSEQIYSSSQTLKLQRYASAAEQVAGAVQQIVSVSSESHFRLVVLSAPNDIPYKVPSDMTALGVGFALCVMVQNLDLKSAVQYTFATKGTQTALLRRHTKEAAGTQVMGGGAGGFFGVPAVLHEETGYITSVGMAVEPAGDWEVRLWFPAEGRPNKDELDNEVADCVELQIDKLQPYIT